MLNLSEISTQKGAQMSYKNVVCGYFYGEEFDYITLISSSQKQVFKFLFKDGKIYKEDLEHECDKSTFGAAIKGICNEYTNKILNQQIIIIFLTIFYIYVNLYLIVIFYLLFVW